MDGTLCVFALICILSFEFGLGQNCNINDFDFTFTECEANGDRWKVPIPHAGKICTTGIPLPIKGPKCGFTCPNGNYLNLNSGSCAPCPPGSYSISNGRIFDNFDTIPSQFTAEAFSETHESANNCSDAASWIPYGTYLSSAGVNCASLLRFADNFVKDGFVEFEYLLTDANRVAFVNIQNDKCQVDQDSANSFLEMSGPKEWRRKKIALKKGRNIITWTTYVDNTDSTDGEVFHSNLLIRAITISGLAYNRECTPCKPGSYTSAIGSTQCHECPKDTFSNKGSQICIKCTPTQYAFPGASKCIERKSCQTYNKYQYSDACNPKEETRLFEAWTEPKICREDLKESVHLNNINVKMEYCLPCNKGERKLNSTHCTTCTPRPANSPVEATCVQCPSNTQPIYGMELNRWSRWPDKISTFCTNPPYAGEENCHPSNLWQLQRTQITAGLGVGGGGYSILNLNLDKPANSSLSNTYTLQVTMNFSLTCVGNCSFIFMLDMGDAYLPVKIWKQSVKYEVYTHHFKEFTPPLVVWGFHKTERNWNDLRYADHVSIHSITVSGMSTGTIIGCKECPLGVKSTGCIPCPSGQYFDQKTRKCTSCPPGKVLNHDSTSSQSPDKVCISCGENLIAFDGRKCISPPFLPSTLQGSATSLNTTQSKPYYHMEEIMKKEMTTSSAYLFTSVGSKYYYVFNFTLANKDFNKYPLCVANYTSNKGKSSVRSLICRTTFIPSTVPGGPPITAQVTSLGDELVAISKTDSSEEFRKEINENLTQSGWTMDKLGYDIHYQYRSFAETRACPQGRHTTLTLRCISDENEDTRLAQVEVAPRCPYGSCDGCHFHFLWRTSQACPICHPDSYSQVEEECQLGRQVVHFIPPPHCYVGGRKPPELPVRIQPCPLFTKITLIMIAVALSIGGILILILLHCHRRNKKLEYKYMRLVSARPGGRDGMDDGAELPGAESCAVEDDEFGHDFSSELDDNKGSRWPLQPLQKSAKEGQIGVGFMPMGSQGDNRGRIPNDELSQSGVGGRKGGSANKIIGKIRNAVPIGVDQRRGFDSLETVNLTETVDYGH